MPRCGSEVAGPSHLSTPATKKCPCLCLFLQVSGLAPQLPFPGWVPWESALPQGQRRAWKSWAGCPWHSLPPRSGDHISAIMVLRMPPRRQSPGLPGIHLITALTHQLLIYLSPCLRGLSDLLRELFLLNRLYF